MRLALLGLAAAPQRVGVAAVEVGGNLSNISMHLLYTYVSTFIHFSNTS